MNPRACGCVVMTYRGLTFIEIPCEVHVSNWCGIEDDIRRIDLMVDDRANKGAKR